MCPWCNPPPLSTTPLANSNCGDKRIFPCICDISMQEVIAKSLKYCSIFVLYDCITVQTYRQYSIIPHIYNIKNSWPPCHQCLTQWCVPSRTMPTAAMLSRSACCSLLMMQQMLHPREFLLMLQLMLHWREFLLMQSSMDSPGKLRIWTQWIWMDILLDSAV